MNQLDYLHLSPVQFIKSTGEAVDTRLDDICSEQLVKFYQTMVLIRHFDKKAIALQRTGQLGTYPSCLGQEAFSTGIGYAMQADDVLAPYYRDQAAQYLRGVRLDQMLQLWGGDERGNDVGGNARWDLPNCVPIATQITHAAGIATAFKCRNERRAVVTTCGDGATSRGDFYESLNVAGTWQLPLVIVVNNNQWAISVPRDLQTGAQTIAQKALAAGIEGVVVDGNDVSAVYATVSEALDKARHGKGATLIEAITYRLGDHTTADDATRYRAAEEVNRAWEHEPIKRLQTYLHQKGLWDPEKEQALQEQVQNEVEQAVETYLTLPPQQPTDCFDYLFEELPAALAAQRDRLANRQLNAGD